MQCQLANSHRYSAGNIPPPIKWVLEVTQPWREFDRSPPSTGEVRNVLSYTCTSPHVLMSCTGTTGSSLIFRVKLSGLLDLFNLKMENLSSSEMSVTVYQSEWRAIPDIFYFNHFGCDNLKSRTVRDVFRVPDSLTVGNTRRLVGTRVQKRPPEPQLKYSTLLDSYEQVCTINFLPKQIAAPSLRTLSTVSRHQTFHKTDTTLTYHIQGAKSPCG